MLVRSTVDANEAVARIAYAASEVIAIYPITPASPMGEHADQWMSERRSNVFGTVPDVIEMQSEGGAAGAVHGALQAGALSTTFTASQGLLLMIPNMYKIAGELTPTVFHVAARTVATHALSIFGDHSDVMACRSTGWAMLCSSSVQEAPDMALIAHAATLETRLPFLHFFDGFRTSHELNCIFELNDDRLRTFLNASAIADHRRRGLTPDHPQLRGSAQNPDVFFQAREAINTFYQQAPGLVQAAMDRFGELTGRRYRLFEYYGAADAERVIVLMGSGIGAAEEAVDYLVSRGERVGIVKVRLYRPFDVEAFGQALPTTTQQIAVLDRVKEPGAVGEPLYQDVVAALHELSSTQSLNHRSVAGIVGGRYGLASKEFTPAMVMAIFNELQSPQPKRSFTVGIVDDVTHRSLPIEADIDLQSSDALQAVFYGLGSDGTVGANKNTVKIIGDNTQLFARGYFVYDSKKSGAMTVSHLRISPRPIRSTYLIQRANFVACHQLSLIDRVDILQYAAPGATLLLNTTYSPDEVWDKLTREFQAKCIELKLRLFVVDAETVAARVGMVGRINIVMQVCFFAVSQVLPRDEAIAHIKQAIEKTYGKRGASIIDKNFAAVDQALAGLHEVPLPLAATSLRERQAVVPPTSSEFVQRVTAAIMRGWGDRLPVSALPVDGTFPTHTAHVEKRSIAAEIPGWEPDICIQCGLCTLVCPHAAIRFKAFTPAVGETLSATFPVRPWTNKEFPGYLMTLQVAPDDCTGCGVCVDVCPAKSKQAVRIKAINMVPKETRIDRERENFSQFLSIPEFDRAAIDTDTVKGSQLLLPLFEYSGACGGCGETPYLKLLSQLFGDRMVVANATGCSSIYGGNLPTTPWSTDAAGRGPAWANSLFEDNAEFGLGIRLGLDKREQTARRLLLELAPTLPANLVDRLLQADQRSEADFAQQRERVELLRQMLADNASPTAALLQQLADALVKKVVWIVGGDGWAYDIGFGGLDHVLASGKNVNAIVLDTEVYSNTGGQSSKSTPRAAVAKFASAGKAIGKKDIGMIAMAYGHVYVAQIAIGAHPLQAIKALHEAESYPGPSLILAYSQCIAHGVNLTVGMSHQKEAVHSGYWPLYRYDPRVAHDGGKPFHLDCRKPTLSFQEFAAKEARFSMLTRSDPVRAAQLMALAQQDIDDRWHYYEQIANVERSLAGFFDEVPV